jgi:preprotein translocase subunit SecG
MTGLFIFVHVVVCLVLIVIILAQSGRGGGLTEGFAAAESVFGARTNEFMVKATAIAGVIFLFTSLMLAHLSSRADRSLMTEKVAQELPLAQEAEKVLLDIPDEARAPEAKAVDDINGPVQVETTQEVVR